MNIGKISVEILFLLSIECLGKWSRIADEFLPVALLVTLFLGPPLGRLIGKADNVRCTLDKIVDFYHYHFSSGGLFRSGLTNPRRGEALRNCVRVLELSLSNRRLGIPVKYLHAILRSCPRLLELRLRVGAEVNTFYPTILQERRLRNTFSTTLKSLRALQVFVDQRSTKSRVFKEVQALTAGAELDFVALATDSDKTIPPTFDPLQYDVEVESYSRFTWPVETNSLSISMANINPSQSTEPSNPVIKPETIRFHSDNTHNGAFFDLFAPHIKNLLYRVWSHSSVWGQELHTLLTKCPGRYSKDIPNQL
ncbi:17322_t:CDS:1 [Acaulospora colombiana]|uniref:17322_t:CDS:1 n=1 Tax=Acaulospora colombiana TaxID=27376 RepID=A0ACA9ND18_9GLOM|nr:17322_t:CDS:1 [Acaulospora colombiana]